MQNEVSPASRAHLLFRHLTLPGLSRVLSPELVDEAAREFGSPKSRRRALTLQVMVWLGIFMALERVSSIEKALVSAWSGLRTLVGGNLPLLAVTQSAYTQARRRVPLRMLRWIWDALVDSAQKRWPEEALYHGRILLGLDGTTLELPEWLRVFVGGHRGTNSEGPCTIRFMVAYLERLRIPIAMSWSRLSTGEKTIAWKILRQLPAAALLVFDGGFEGFAWFWHIPQGGRDFITRGRHKSRARVLEVLGPGDERVAFPVCALTRRQNPELPAEIVVRRVRSERKGFRPCWLITSLLDPVEWPREDVVEAYSRRWPIETFYGELKNALGIEHWHSRTLRGILQELHSAMILWVIVRSLMAEAAERAGLHPTRLSIERCLDHVAAFVARVLNAPPAVFRRELDQLFEYLARQVIRERPGRRYPRSPVERRALQIERAERERRRPGIPRPSRTPVVRRRKA
jgi:hypothetical protein